jgi:hypothetical protein
MDAQTQSPKCKFNCKYRILGCVTFDENKKIQIISLCNHCGSVFFSYNTKKEAPAVKQEPQRVHIPMGEEYQVQGSSEEVASLETPSLFEKH